jgi:hypothetical protein
MGTTEGDRMIPLAHALPWLHAAMIGLTEAWDRVRREVEVAVDGHADTVPLDSVTS